MTAKPGRPLATTARVDAFTDAVLAIVMTLMAVELVPPSRDAVAREGLWQALLAEWPALLAFVLSFLLVAQVWMSHHSMWRWVARVDRPLLTLQVLHLMFVTLVPFASRLLAEHLEDEDSAGRTGAALYAGIVLMNGIFFNLVWRYALARGLTAPELPRPLSRRLSLRYASGIPLYSAALGLAFVDVWLSLVVYLLLIIYFVVPGPGEQHAAPDDQ